MVIAIFLTILAILSIAFYFLPFFSVKHKANPSSNFEVVNYSGWEMTKAVFTDTKYMGSNMEGLQYIKDTYSFAIILSGILMPLAIICTIATTVFTYISWLKSDAFKKFCFLFSLCGMMFATLTLISTWFVAIQIKDGNNFNFFNYNIRGNITYGVFVSLILSFVVAIIACAYNYFLDNFDDEEDDEEDDELTDHDKKVKAAETLQADGLIDQVELDKIKATLIQKSNSSNSVKTQSTSNTIKKQKNDAGAVAESKAETPSATPGKFLSVQSVVDTPAKTKATRTASKPKSTTNSTTKKTTTKPTSKK